MKERFFIAICGPTASGKTGLSLELAQWLKTEIISFDSRQFYRELKIGAAPPSEEELKSVTHHFIQNLSIEQDYSAGTFEKDAHKVMHNLFNEHNSLIGVGGSGLFLKAITEGFDDLPSNASKVRDELNSIFKEEGLIALQEELKHKDPEYYNKVDQKNPVRIIRALEVIRTTGKPYSEQRVKKPKQRDFDTIAIGIDYDRDKLYERINNRVDIMIEQGLLDEVRTLLPYREKNALQTVGYKEIFEYLDGNSSLDHAISEIKKNSRRYAKRQMTWFRNNENVEWFKPGDLENIKSYIRQKTGQL